MEIEQILAELDSIGLPVEALEAADGNRAALVPVFLDTIERHLASGAAERLGDDVIFHIFHLLGAWREKRAYRPLARLLRDDSSATEDIFGAAIHVTVHRVMAAVFDGDPQPLYDVIFDAHAHPDVRARMFHTVAMLTLSDELPRAEAAKFVRTCYTELEPRHENYVWNGWQAAVVAMRLVELKPLVEQAFRRGYVDKEWLTFEDFEEELKIAVADPDALAFADDYTPFGDAIEELTELDAQLSAGDGADDPDEADLDPDHGPYAADNPPPAVNPFRHVGRNDPCPCGSGKKFKKCCLTKVEAGEAIDRPA